MSVCSSPIFKIISRPYSDRFSATAFVSSYHQIPNSEIRDFLTRIGLEYKETSVGFTSRYCPLCPKPHYEERSNLYTLGFKANSGVFHCFRCGVSGSWYDFKNLITGSSLTVESLKSPEVTYPSLEEHTTRYNNLKNSKFPAISQYLKEVRGLTQETLEKYMVGIDYKLFKNPDTNENIDLPCVFFPMYSIVNSERLLSRVKIRAIYKENKHYMKMHPVGGGFGFFGLNTIPPGIKTLVITEGEYDAMAVYQSTGLFAISLPNGASHLPVQMLPWLEQFHKIYLWLDDDLAGREASLKFAKKLGLKRTFIVKTKDEEAKGPKDANEALLLCTHEDMKKFIIKSKPIAEENITTFRELREEVYNKITKHQEESGLMCSSFNWYNQKTKGFRKGELSIITGATGSGKTTFLSQLSLDFCQKGIPTLWGSFEIKNEVLLKKLLIQHAKVDLTLKPELFAEYADNFQELPLYLLKFFGSTDIDKILDTMDFATYAYDIGHVVIDNLQFMLSGQALGVNKFDLQDQVISKFRNFATDKNVHLSIVIHPKKIDDESDLNIASVFGSAKATQEADNIFVLQNRHKYRLMDIRKNRFDGEVGRVGLGFNKEIQCFFELTPQEVTSLRTEPEYSMADVLKFRNISKP
jgi:twinkle protein